jgi:TetR/AcrR family tetracycline transcriptional repressor
MPLSRDQVLRAALEVLDEEGLDALTMRSLAQFLDVQPGAIYWHFADKQELYDAMVDHSMADILDRPLAGSWDRQLAEMARRMAAALLAHRDGARLATLALRPGPNSLEVTETMLAVVRQGGFEKRATLWAAAVIGYYVIGYVTDVQATESAKSRGLKVVLRSFQTSLKTHRYPLLEQASQAGLAQMLSARAFRERFEFGLEVILTGLKARRRAARYKRR